ncbi:MAG TPA: CHAT domain-containing protein [Myxococcales bacterium]|nr:CHAT domain-containing protein [Myxococcales bacterium]
MAKKKAGAPGRRPARKPPAAQPAQAPAAAQAHGAFTMGPEEIERALLTGEARGVLEDYFGPESYGELRDLSRDASTRSVRGGPRVLILPGIMGSTLGRRGHGVLWINPLAIAFGRLTELSLNGRAPAVDAVGVVLLAYLKLKLRLKISGFDADFFPYDWRRSLKDAGKSLSDAILQDPAAEVKLVAHSMGGLVARAALAAAGKKVSRLIMLGTPNYGSFAPAQVIRGTYDVVQKVAAADLEHDAAQLCTLVFNTFPGLYQMLPAPEKFSGVDLYDPSAWPQAGPRPRPNLLAGVKPVIDALAPADERFFLVAGVNQDTVVGLRVNDGEFCYDVSPDGDGTVPLAFARLANLPDAQTYYVEEGHGSLPNNGRVESAVIDLLATGRTSVLPTVRPPSQRAASTVTESQLRQMARRAPGIGQLGSSDYRHLLDAVAAPPKPETGASAASLPVAGQPGAAAAPGASGKFENLTISRTRLRRLALTLAHGSIADVDSPAYVVGVFRNVAPSGAAAAIDRRLGGTIAEFTARRMFGGEVGTVFMLPVGRSPLGADLVLFAGMGAFDQFNGDVQQLVAENVVRVLTRTRIDEFATVLIGGSSAPSAAGVLQNLLLGFLRGLKDADPRQRFRGITLCETDAGRFAELKAEMYRLAGTSLFDDVELTLDETELPPPSLPAPRPLAQVEDPVYVMVRAEAPAPGRLDYRVSILGAGMKAAVVTAAQAVSAAKLDALLARFDQAVEGGEKDLTQFGAQFADLALPAEVCTVLAGMRERHIVIVHDAPAARIPWETLTVGDWTPALTGGLSRHYMADHMPVAAWLEERRAEPVLRLLLVVNPLGDLAGADDEGERIMQLGGATDGIEITPLVKNQATKAAVIAALRTGKFDCVHYAGHAFFDPQGPSRSGLICAGREILSGADLTGFSNLPSLVFFNACEAGRVRGRPVKGGPASARVRESYGVAEALMRGGIANYMSTYWPVGDAAAETFATTFYGSVLAGKSLGASTLEGRKAVLALRDRDWADYILYGNFDFVLKQPQAR